MNLQRPLLAVSLFTLVATAWAQQTQPTTQPATLPSAQELIGRYVDATGGATAYESVKTRRSTGTFALADLGIDGTLTTLIRRDGTAISTTVLPGQGTRRRGVNNGIVWETDFDGTARILDGVAARAVARSLTLFPLITLEGYRDAKVSDVVELNGRKTFRMLLISEADVSEMRFYDVESSLLVKIIIKLSGPAGESLLVNTNFSEYEDVAPIRMPLKTQQMMTGMSPESMMTKVEHDVELPDSLFALPPEIVKLLPTTKPTR